jgi:hypothetical protein
MRPAGAARQRRICEQDGTGSISRAGSLGEAGVGLLALGEGSRVVHRRADQRVAEANRVAGGDELPGLGRGGRLQGEAQFLAGLGEQAAIPGGAAGSVAEWRQRCRPRSPAANRTPGRRAGCEDSGPRPVRGKIF